MLCNEALQVSMTATKQEPQKSIPSAEDLEQYQRHYQQWKDTREQFAAIS
jgi:hypothetical protein